MRESRNRDGNETGVEPRTVTDLADEVETPASNPSVAHDGAREIGTAGHGHGPHDAGHPLVTRLVPCPLPEA